jgi:hypothetical protein
MPLFGVLGFVLTRLRYHPAPLVFGFILGPHIENGLVQSTMIGGAQGGVLAYMTLRPMSMVLIVICVISACWPLVAARIKARTAEPEPTVLTGKGINADLILGAITLVLAGIAYLNTRNLSRFGGLLFFTAV